MVVRTRTVGRGMNDQRAIIDIGSNTVRMVIFGGPQRAPSALFNEKVTARLARGVIDNGLLSDKSMAIALTGLARFAELLKLRDVREVEVVATAAVRDAQNGGKFLAQVERLGLKPRLLSGEEEAVTSAMGVLGSFPGARGVVADLGGGSLELVHVEGEACEHGISLPLGTLRLPKLRDGGNAKFARRIHRVVRSADWQCQEGEALYLVGGSTRAFARVAMNEMAWPLDDPNGFELPPERALQICRSLLRGSLLRVPEGIGASRMAALPDTAALLSALIKEIRPERLVFSSWGLREGLLYASLGKAPREQDPLLAGVFAFAETMGIPAAHGAMVAGWTAEANPADGAHRESLRLAATMLALASQRLEPNLRAGHACDWALRKRWIGINAEGRAVMAACVLANGGRASPPMADLERLASPQSLREAQIWGLAIRLCRRLSGVSPQALANSRLTVEDGTLVLAVREDLKPLFTDTVEKDLRALAERLDLQPTFRLLA